MPLRRGHITVDKLPSNDTPSSRHAISRTSNVGGENVEHAILETECLPYLSSRLARVCKAKTSSENTMILSPRSSCLRIKNSQYIN